MELWPVDSGCATAKSFPLIKYLEKSFLLPSGGAFEIFQEWKKILKKKKKGEKKETSQLRNRDLQTSKQPESYLWLQLSQGNQGSWIL